MRLLVGVAAATLFTAGTAQAQSEPAKPAEKLVCKRVYNADTGSHFQSSKRVCRTALEWKEIEDGTARSMQNLRSYGGRSGQPGGGGGPGGGPQ